MKRLVLSLALLSSATAAHAEWQYTGGEGTYYAYTTDGGFIDGTYQNGLMLFCPSDGNFCQFSVVINGETPQPPAIVSFAFDNGQLVERITESVAGGDPEVGFEGELQEALMSNNSVTGQYTFSLKGSSAAIAEAVKHEMRP